MTEILKALRKARSEFPPVVKDQENPFFHSKYAALDTIIKAVTPALDENELTLLAGFDVIDGQSAIWMELHHDSGETLPKSTLLIPVKRTTKTDAKTGEVTLTENNPQDVGSGISYMVRYSIKTYLGLPLEDDDGNRSSGRGQRQPSRPQGSTQQPTETPSKAAGGGKGASDTPSGDVTVLRNDAVKASVDAKNAGIPAAELGELKQKHFGGQSYPADAAKLVAFMEEVAKITKTATDLEGLGNGDTAGTDDGHQE